MHFLYKRMKNKAVPVELTYSRERHRRTPGEDALRYVTTHPGGLSFCSPLSLFEQASPSKAQAADDTRRPGVNLRVLRDARTRQLVFYSTRRRST
jgi:hypothetical protein